MRVCHFPTFVTERLYHPASVPSERHIKLRLSIVLVLTPFDLTSDFLAQSILYSAFATNHGNGNLCVRHATCKRYSLHRSHLTVNSHSHEQEIN